MNGKVTATVYSNWECETNNLDTSISELEAKISKWKEDLDASE